jgi:hypothetical protein
MQKILACVLVVGFAGTSGLVFHGMRGDPHMQAASAQMAVDGAYRDGLFLGKMSRQGQHSALPPVGRWSTEKDRASFLQGYRQGLSEKNAE